MERRILGTMVELIFYMAIIVLLVIWFWVMR